MRTAIGNIGFQVNALQALTLEDCIQLGLIVAHIGRTHVLEVDFRLLIVQTFVLS